MELGTIDIITFIAFVALVVGISLWASRSNDDSAEGYFLAGRSLGWGFIGFSLIASNISTEQFVGMAGAGFGEMGLAVAAYEWIAAITLVVVALVLLPRFLRAGIYTIPEYLAVRFDERARFVMSVFMLIMYAFVALASILYSGALGLQAIFGIEMLWGVWLLGILAALYTVYGGLAAVVWSDFIQAIALLVGGAVVAWLALDAVGGIDAFIANAGDKLHLVLPADHDDMPWTALLLGIWIPNLFYWGLNQFITQRTLGAKSLAQGQRGVIFAAVIKLIMPLIVVFPGIAAFQLYGAEIPKADQAYPILVTKLLPAGMRGFMLAALFGAIMSSLDSLLNSASTIFTMDVYRRHINRDADTAALAKVGRWATAVLVVFGCLVAPLLDNPAFGGIFKYIQMFQGFISPGIVVVFVFAMFVPKAPPEAALVGLLGNVVVYGALLYFLPDIAFLNHMGITAVVLAFSMGVVTTIAPRRKPAREPDASPVELERSRGSAIVGSLVVATVVALYVVFW